MSTPTYQFVHERMFSEGENHLKHRCEGENARAKERKLNTSINMFKRISLIRFLLPFSFSLLPSINDGTNPSSWHFTSTNRNVRSAFFFFSRLSRRQSQKRTTNRKTHTHTGIHFYLHRHRTPISHFSSWGNRIELQQLSHCRLYEHIRQRSSDVISSPSSSSSCRKFLAGKLACRLLYAIHIEMRVNWERNQEFY